MTILERGSFLFNLIFFGTLLGKDKNENNITGEKAKIILLIDRASIHMYSEQLQRKMLGKS